VAARVRIPYGLRWNPWSEALNGLRPGVLCVSGVRPMRPKLLDKALGGGAWWRGMKVQITLEIEDELADPDHPMGVTDEGYQQIVHALMGIGDDVDVERFE
jgi:hypothetical protein